MTDAEVESTGSARIVVVGNQGVGKTSVLRLLANPSDRPSFESPTVGCETEVLLHQFRGKKYFMELLEVGADSQFALSRSVFYVPLDGMILVHDLSNRNTYRNLRSWIREVLGKVEGGWTQRTDTQGRPFCQLESPFLTSPIPVLVIGNKKDLTSSSEDASDSLLITCKEAWQLCDNSQKVKLEAFFDQILNRKFVEKKSDSYFSRSSTTSTSNSSAHDDLFLEMVS